MPDLKNLRTDAAAKLAHLIAHHAPFNPTDENTADAIPIVDAIAHYVLQLVRLEHHVKPFRAKGLTLTPILTPPNHDAGDAGDPPIHDPPDPRT